MRDPWLALVATVALLVIGVVTTVVVWKVMENEQHKREHQCEVAGQAQP